MKSSPGLPDGNNWKNYLRLGELLLECPNALEQCKLIQAAVQENLAADATVWLAHPYFPLPGEPQVDVLPGADAPAIVQQAWERRRICALSGGEYRCPRNPAKLETTSIAIPLLTQNFLLGILHAQRNTGAAFSLADLDFLTALSSTAALSMQVSRQVTLKNWRYGQLSLVGSVSEQIANITDIDELCTRVTRLILDTFHYAYVAIFTLDPGGETLTFRTSASTTESHGLPPCFQVELNQGMVGHVAATRKELLAQDVTREPHYQPIDTLPETRSEIVLPMLIENRLLGVLDVQSDRLDGFHEVDILVLRALAGIIAQAIQRINLFHSLQWRAEQFAAISEVGSALASILDLDLLLEEVVQVIQKRFGYPYVHVFSVQSGRRKIFYKTGSGVRSASSKIKELTYDLDDPAGLIPLAGREGRTILANDVTLEPLYRPSDLPPANTAAELALPITFAGDTMGVLDIQSDQVNEFSQDDVMLLEALTSSIAIAMRNANLYRGEQWRRKVADSFRDVAALISANTAIDQLLAIILERLETHLPCEASAIWLVQESDNGDDSGNILQLAAVRGVNAETLYKAWVNSETVRTWLDAALVAEDPIIRKSVDPVGPLGKALGFDPKYSSIAAPLREGNKPLGLLTLAHSSEGRYGSEAFSITKTFASYAAVAIQNARYLARSQEQAWISTILLQVAEASQAAENTDDLLKTMARLVPLLVGFKKCAFFLWDEYRQGYVLKSWVGLDIRSPDLFFDVHQAPAFARLLDSTPPLFIHDPLHEINLPAAALENDDDTLLMFPLAAHQKVLGAFLVAHEITGQTGAQKYLDEQTLSFLRGIARQTAIALENLLLLETRQEDNYVTEVLLQVAQAVVAQGDFNDTLDGVIHLLPVLAGIDGCAIYLWNHEKQVFMTSHVHTGDRSTEDVMLKQTFPPGVFPLLDQAFNQDTPYYCPLPGSNVSPSEWPNLPCLPFEGSPPHSAGMEDNWLLAFPLSVKNERFGVLLARECCDSSVSLRDKRIDIVRGTAQQLSAAIQNEQYQREVVARERFDREMLLARQMQLTFLPNELPSLPGWQVAARWQTARTVGGDFYDVFQLNDGRLGLVIADVSDKGMGAALYMTVTRTLIRSNLTGDFTPATVLQRVNSLLQVDSQNGMFVTSVFIILDPATGMLTYANAGHNLPLIRRANTRGVEILPRGGTALGVVENSNLVDHQVSMLPGDLLLLYTDGVTESFSPDNEAFGEDRLAQVLAQFKGRAVRALFDRLDEALEKFRAGVPPGDDITLVALMRTPQK